MIRVTDTIVLEDRDVKERFVRASGPGGQNVKKEATAVELRWISPGHRYHPMSRSGCSRSPVSM